ncbi:MAG: hypothetical protein IIB02_03305 [Thaumarchaeota archaeon]|nr:hypothetical protein [Nitrososphaerota archaeon]
MKYPNKQLLTLVENCMNHRFTESEALPYIKEQYKEITLKTFYNYKKYINSDESINNFFSYSARIGFVKEHLKRIKEWNSRHDIMIKKWYQLVKEDQDWDLILKLGSHITELATSIISINDSNPTMSELKRQMDRLKAYDNEQKTPAQQREHDINAKDSMTPRS